MQRHTIRTQCIGRNPQLEVQLAYLAIDTHPIRLKCALPFRDETYRICMGHTTARQNDPGKHDPLNAAGGNTGYQFALSATGIAKSVESPLQERV